MSELIQYQHIKKEYAYDGDVAGGPHATAPIACGGGTPAHGYHDTGDTASYSVITMHDGDGSLDFPWPVYKKYFRVLKIEDKVCYKKLKVKCLICVGTKELTMDTRSNSNLRKHLSVILYLRPILFLFLDIPV